MMGNNDAAITHLSGSPHDFDNIANSIARSQYVLLGEASHGTHEFYQARAQITMRLIQHHGFNAVAVEADWPDAYRVNRYVKCHGSDSTAQQALSDFERFPGWMWRNEDVLSFVSQLHQHNQSFSNPDDRAGFFGIDLFSLNKSMEAVITYLKSVDSEAAKRAQERYDCFDIAGRDAQQYGMLASLGLQEHCEKEVIAQMMELRNAADAYIRRDGVVGCDEQFYAEQNAIVVANAERYYRSMFYGRDNSWNIRDTHMEQTLQMLTIHLSRTIPNPKVVVWAHNSHLGDARATDQSARGELNLGQLVRQNTLLPMSPPSASAPTMVPLPPHQTGMSHRSINAYVPACQAATNNCSTHGTSRSSIPPPTKKNWPNRAIGVIYRPDTERQSHYYLAELPSQFDWIIHYDKTSAVVPLEKGQLWNPEETREVPESYPTGL